MFVWTGFWVFDHILCKLAIYWVSSGVVPVLFKLHTRTGNIYNHMMINGCHVIGICFMAINRSGCAERRQLAIYMQ